MSERYVAALDQGTTSTRCILFDRHGRMVSIAQREHRQHFPHPGWVEHDAAEIWSVVRKVVPQALADADVDPSQVIALGVTNQRETVVLWDRRTGQPVHRAVVWQDTRTVGLLEEIAREMSAEEIRRRTGLPLFSYFSGPKLRWIFERHPHLYERAVRGELMFGTMDSWIVWNLTGGVEGGRHVTDVTNASRTMLMDLDTLDWDDDLLDVMRVPRAVLPEIRSTMGTVGTTVAPVRGLPVAAVIGDQQASLFGQTAFEAGDAKCTFGTGSFLLLNTGETPIRSRHELITTVAHRAEGQPAVYALEGSTAVAGGLVQWCRDNLGLIRTPAEIETLAATVSDNGGCYVVPAFSGLFAPYWDPGAQGTIVGLTSYVSKGHIARAVLEATAWQTRDLVEAMNADAGVPARSLLVDGGMTGDNLLMQAVADALGIPVVRPIMAETVARGAAYAAGLTVGYWADRNVLKGQWQRAAEWHPQVAEDRRELEYRHWQHAVALAREWGRRTAADRRD
ncbi:glycerol kinase GlpK [Nakamurella sp. YIM 132087]|uniref:Glycerol kinase n=1 Tax=Nakamurella alba TaxID=2665158 RepID=A0A7K1FQP5_9ACTN|nr:glycerol kinase GlpK [Nakamurella alba]MTD16475.1 glycerol kinase GlpK [Nakamurella alba]